MIDIKEITRVFELQRAQRRAMKATTAEERIARLERLEDALKARAGDIGTAINADLGRPVDNRDEVDTVLRNIDKARNELADWMKPTPVPATPGLSDSKATYMMYEPRGVVLLFGTWDFPIGMFFSPLVQAISAGNVIIGKTNSMAPATGAVIAEIVRDIFDESEVAIFTESEVSTPEGTQRTNDALLELPVDHYFLTGSPNVGRKVVAKAADRLTSFTLELGGKSPAIVDADIDLDFVAQQLVPAKVYNHGQTCLTVDYMWLPEDRVGEFVSKYVAALKNAFYEGDEFQWERDGRFVNKKNFERVRGYLDEAIEKGADVAFGGTVDEKAMTIEPTVLLDVPLDCDVIREEIFGPLLPILTYKDEEEVFEHSDTLGKPLGFYIYSENDDFIDRILANTTSGGVTVNGFLDHWAEENLPFGGVNSSGYGRYHGQFGSRELSNVRSVFHGLAQ